MTAVLAVDLGRSACRVAAGADTVRVGPGTPGLAAPDGVVAAEAAILSMVARWDGDVGVAVAGALAAPEAAYALAERLSSGLGARRVAVVSDALASYVGALGGARGVVLAVGTGVVAVGPDGQVVDGLGPWLGDEGGGGWLGLAGLRAAMGGAVALREAAVRRYGDVAQAMARHVNPPAVAAQFAPDVLALAAAGDAVAAGLVEGAAAALVRTVRRAAAGEREACAVVGGLAEAMRDRVWAALGGEVEPLAALGSALDGARQIATDSGTAHERHVHRCGRASGGELDWLATEGVRAGLADLDLRSPAAVVALVLEAERGAQAALARAEPALGRAAEAVAARMRAGGRLFYLGAGTPGRLAALDAAELGPTYSAPPGLVVPLLAGGPGAMLKAVEGAEDDALAAGLALDAAGLQAGDAVVGITASGRTPFVLGGLRHARAAGALTVAVVNNAGSGCAAAAELAVEVLTGAEVVAGSTRMMAGTVQKVVLNALSTAVMVALGKTYGPYMVDVAATNVKLRRRAVRIVQQVTGAAEADAAAALAAAGGRVKPALVALLAGVTPLEADRRLVLAGGRVRAALA